MKAAGSDYRSGPVVWCAVLLSTCVVLFLFQKMLWLVVPFILGLIVYYLLLPIKLRLMLAGMHHDLAAGAVIAVAFALLGLGTLFTLPTGAADFASWHNASGRYIEGGIQLLTQTVRQLEGKAAILANAHISDQLAQAMAELTGGFAQKYLPEIAVTLAAWAPSLLLAPFVAFFMLRDGWRFKRFIGAAVPNAFFERSLYLINQVDKTARYYFIGLIQLTVLDTLCLALGLWFLGLSSPLLLGLLTAVLAWVPFVGSVLGCILVVLVAATDFPANPEMAYGAVALFLAVRLLDDFVFMPMTIGKSLKMHPLLTVLMIFVGGAVAGIPGLMLVLPVLGVFMVLGETLGRVITDHRLRARHLHARSLRRKAAMADLEN